MGMDSYLERTLKKDHERFTKELYRREELNRKNKDKITILSDSLISFYDTLNSRHPEIGHRMDRKCLCKYLTTEEMCTLDGMRDELNKLTGGDEPIDCGENEELMYWRKPFPLHGYIVENFLEHGRSDNCERIVLSVSNMQKIVDEINICLTALDNGKNPPGYFSVTDYWSVDRMKDTVKAFEHAIAESDDEHVVYYYAWY